MAGRDGPGLDRLAAWLGAEVPSTFAHALADDPDLEHVMSDATTVGSTSARAFTAPDPHGRTGSPALFTSCSCGFKINYFPPSTIRRGTE